MGDAQVDAMTEPAFGSRALLDEIDLSQISNVHRLLNLFCIPSSHAINLEIDPPYARNAHHGPQRSTLAEVPYRQPLEDEEITQSQGQ